MQKEYHESDQLTFKDESDVKHGLHGHVQIFRHNKETDETTFWYESDNVIPLSGYQHILMKLFGLFLDSSHNKVTDNLTRDTNLATPDLNEKLAIGTKPANYTAMDDNISVNHICQGFMVGNGGAGEDSVTTKNTAYSYISLRNPIPFQQVEDINTTIAGKYLGHYYGNDITGKKLPNSLYIKKFDETPHIYHSWWVDGQRWDYVDPVSQNDLGPDAVNGTPKTNRIETYVECKLSISDTDCKAYFAHNNETAVINELGLVAFDATDGDRSKIERTYAEKIQDLIMIIYDKKMDNPDADDFSSYNKRAKQLIVDIHESIDTILTDRTSETHLLQFITTLPVLTTDDVEDVNNVLDYEMLRTALSDSGNIGVQAFYNQNSTLMYTTDQFLGYLSSSATNGLSVDEAQRIKLITYYTFNSIPLSKNWEILINYRIYAN